MLRRDVRLPWRANVKRALLAWLRCPVCHTCLDPGTDLDPIDAGRLTCLKAHSFPIVRGIPRFVVSDAYTRSFSYEWNRFRKTQLDSQTGRTDTRDRLQASLNFPLEKLEGKLVLDAGCGMGRFAEVIHRYGGEYVGLDYSFAVDAANANAGDLERVHFVQADLFAWLRDVLPSGQRFDVVVLDPSKQTRDREAVGLALKRYLDMNRLALQAVTPGGIFLTCSCTGLVSEETFLDTIRRAAWQAGKIAQVLRVTGAGPDHPFLAQVPEGRYLKVVWCRVG